MSSSLLLCVQHIFEGKGAALKPMTIFSLRRTLILPELYQLHNILLQPWMVFSYYYKVDND